MKKKIRPVVIDADAIRIRKSFAPPTKRVESKKRYDRKREKAAARGEFRNGNSPRVFLARMH